MEGDILIFETLIPTLGTAAILGLLSPLVGIFLVMRRFSLLADTLAHVSLLGVAIVSGSGIPMTTGALPAAVLGGLGIELLRQSRRVLSEATLAIFLAGSLALALIIFALQGIEGEELEHYLFGNLAAVGSTDFFLITLLAIVLILFFLVQYRRLFLVTLDEDLARVSGVQVRRLNLLFMLLASAVVAIAIKLVGVLLVSALIVLPVMAALQWRGGFKSTLATSLILSEISVGLGFSLAYFGSLPSGASIALMALLLFLISFFGARLTFPSK